MNCIKNKLISLYETIYTSKIILPLIYWYQNRRCRFHIMTAEETVCYIKKHRCSIARFGEGEIWLIIDKERSLGFQEHDPLLSERLEQVLCNQNPNLLLCLPHALNSIADGRTRHSRMFWYHWGMEHQQHRRTFDLVCRTAGRDYLFGDTQVSRPYVAFQSNRRAKQIFPAIQELWTDRDLLIIEGEKTCLGVGNDLLTNAGVIQRILCPSQNAFQCYYKILQTVKRVYSGQLILLALGPTATIMAAELTDQGMQALDIGHLDIEYEWFCRNMDNHEAIPGKYTNEAENGNPEMLCQDKDYLNQIIARIQNV